MFDIEIAFDDIDISSIQKEDVAVVQDWMQKQVDKNAETVLTNIDELDDRFLEYYLSENEFFLKIKRNGWLIGVFKGRVEFKTPNEVHIWCYILDNDLRGKGMGSKILIELINFFESNYSINNFSTGIIAGSDSAVKFWKKNRFALHRISKSFFNVRGEERDMLVFKRIENVKAT